jgi:hypothetical protein
LANLGDNVPIPKISSKISKAIEDLLKEAIGIPIKQKHPFNTLLPTYPIGIIDNSNKIEEDLAKDWLWLVTGADCGDDCIYVDAKTWKINHG